MVLDIAVSAIATMAKAANCHAASNPKYEMTAAANAPIPNQNNTNPSVNISAIIKATASTSQRIQAI
jgi:hypothetical protein